MVNGNNGTPPSLGDLQEPLRNLRRRFFQHVQPLRPDLYQYFLQLTDSLFDAQELVQQALTRAFGQLVEYDRPPDLRPYIFRNATHLWIDQCHRARRMVFDPTPGDFQTRAGDGEAATDLDQALQRIVDLVEPRERVAVLLHDRFAFGASEIAEWLETSPHMVQTLVHRGRARAELLHACPAPAREMDTAHLRLVERFAERFTAQDWDGVIGLMHTDAVYSLVGVEEQRGIGLIGESALARARRMAPGSRAEWVWLNGEPIVLWLFQPEGETEAIRDAFRIASDGEAITHISDFWYCPDVIHEVGHRLGRRTEPDGDYAP